MNADPKIDVTWNPVTGCTPVSPGCENCYARRFAHRLAGRYGYPAYDSFLVTLHPGRLEEPLRWRKPRRVFVGSMGDLFHEEVPEAFIDQVLEVIAACPQHIFLVLTKRPENINQKIYEPTNEAPVRELGGGDYLPNLWLGVTCENQKAVDDRIPILLQTSAAVRFISVEPMLEPVDLEKQLGNGRIGLVIAGGETGPCARPVYPDWVRNLRDQCQEAGTPFFFKSWGEYCAPSQMPEQTYRAWDIQHGSETCEDNDGPIWHVGKKAAGRLLDGRTWDEFPEVKL